MKNRNKIAAIYSRRWLRRYLVACLLVSGCDYDRAPDFENVESIKGFKPIYRSHQEMQEIQAGPPKPLVNPGKIYVNAQSINHSPK